MRCDKKTKLLAKQLFKLSLANGEIVQEQVQGVLGYIEKTQPRQTIALLKFYHRLISTEFAKSRAVVEHAGAVSDATLRLIERSMSQKYRRTVTAVAKPNDRLLAGFRVRIGSDVFETSVAGQLAALSSAT